MRPTPDPEAYITATIQIGIAGDDTTWSISSWYNKTKQRQSGWGKACLTELSVKILNKYGKPAEISYTWNGQNEYVGRLVTETWAGICNTPLAVLKKDQSDSWDSHLYDLDKDRFLSWLGLGIKLLPKYENKPEIMKEYFCSITELLDEAIQVPNISGRYRHYILADDYCTERNCLAVRVPGRTMGGIWVKKDGCITRIVMDNDTQPMFGKQHPYSERILSQLQTHVGKYILLPKNT